MSNDVNVLDRWTMFTSGLKEFDKMYLSKYFEDMSKYLQGLSEEEFSSFSDLRMDVKEGDGSDLVIDMRVVLFAIIRKMYGKMRTMQYLLDNPKELCDEVVRMSGSKVVLDMLRMLDENDKDADLEAEFCAMSSILCGSELNVIDEREERGGGFHRGGIRMCKK